MKGYKICNQQVLSVPYNVLALCQNFLLSYLLVNQYRYNISANFYDKVLINRKILLLKRPWSGLFACPADEIQKRKSVKGITAISCQSYKFVPIMSWKQCSGSGSVRSVCFGPPGSISGSVIYFYVPET